MKLIKTIEDFIEATNHPYRASGYFLVNDSDVLAIPDTLEDVQHILDVANECGEWVHYGVNWEDTCLYSDSGERIPAAYADL